MIGSIITSIDPSFQYDPIQTIPFYKFRNSQLFDSPDKYSGEDYITGRIGKTDFELAEILAEDKHTDSEGDTSYSTVFRGLFMIADFHKDFQGHTIVVPDNMGEGWFGRNFKSSWKSNMERAKMENTDFENEFDVYTTDQVEARYILSISMLENIFKLKQVFQNDVFIAFHASCIYIGISQWRASFLEPNLKKSLLLESTIHAYFDEFWQVLDIIEEYSGTPSANLASYYAGTAYLRLKDYKNAVEYLSNFKSDDEILAPLAKGNIGDAFVQLNQESDALGYYEQAAEMRNNEFTTPMYLFKAGAIALDLGKADKALAYFERIKADYANSTEASQVDVFIGKAQVLASK